MLPCGSLSIVAQNWNVCCVDIIQTKKITNHLFFIFLFNLYPTFLGRVGDKVASNSLTRTLLPSSSNCYSNSKWSFKVRGISKESFLRNELPWLSRDLNPGLLNPNPLFCPLHQWFLTRCFRTAAPRNPSQHSWW